MGTAASQAQPTLRPVVLQCSHTPVLRYRLAASRVVQARMRTPAPGRSSSLPPPTAGFTTLLPPGFDSTSEAVRSVIGLGAASLSMVDSPMSDEEGTQEGPPRKRMAGSYTGFDAGDGFCFAQAIGLKAAGCRPQAELQAELAVIVSAGYTRSERRRSE